MTGQIMRVKSDRMEAEKTADLGSRIGIILMLLSVLLLIVISGCATEDSSPLYSHFEVIDAARWGAERELFFSTPVEEVTETYSMVGVLRVSPSCRLKSLPIGIVEEDSAGKISTKIVHCPLDAGRAHSVGYNLREYRFEIDDARTFRHQGIHTVSFRHLLKDSIAEGILEIGLIIRPMGIRQRGVDM